MRASNSPKRSRRGATLVEAAIVLPTVFMFIIGMCVIGLGIYRYQQVASLAREGARYASVHGMQYQQDTQIPAATASDIYNNAILPMAVGLNTGSLTYSVNWNTSNWPTSWIVNPNPPPAAMTQDNTVSVTVSYQWTPELYLTGPINLTSTSVMPMSY
jgi:Flp pilus assembly protein TadG